VEIDIVAQLEGISHSVFADIIGGGEVKVCRTGQLVIVHQAIVHLPKDNTVLHIAGRMGVAGGPCCINGKVHRVAAGTGGLASRRFGRRGLRGRATAPDQ